MGAVEILLPIFAVFYRREGITMAITKDGYVSFIDLLSTLSRKEENNGAVISIIETICNENMVFVSPLGGRSYMFGINTGKHFDSIAKKLKYETPEEISYFLSKLINIGLTELLNKVMKEKVNQKEVKQKAPTPKRTKRKTGTKLKTDVMDRFTGETLIEFILKYAVTNDELEKHKVTNNVTGGYKMYNGMYDHNFLSGVGVPCTLNLRWKNKKDRVIRPTPCQYKFANKFLDNNVDLLVLIDDYFDIDQDTYSFKLVLGNDHVSYMVPVRMPN